MREQRIDSYKWFLERAYFSSIFVLVAQWIERPVAVREVQVRLLPGTPDASSQLPGIWFILVLIFTPRVAQWIEYLASNQ